MSAQQPEPVSEGWRRIAGVRCALNPTVRAERRLIRGRRWRILSDPFGDQYLRLTAQAWEFVARLDGRRSVGEIWAERQRIAPQQTPSRDEVARLLALLHQVNMLRLDDPAQGELLFARWRRKQQQKGGARFMSLAAMRLPLLNPARALRALEPLGRILFSWPMALLWALVCLNGARSVIEQVDLAVDQAQGAIAPGNLALLYAAFFGVKLVHELGHALACQRFGGEVKSVGVLLLALAPMPFVDATDSWRFDSRWQRILVASAGMLCELFVGALAAMLWAHSAPGSLIHALAYNVMLVATVTTLLFNANPLMKFDGYFILSDLLDIPNLYQRAQKQVYGLAERLLFGVEAGEPVAHDAREAWQLTLYGVAGACYRVLLFVGLFFYVVNQYLILGLLMGLSLALAWTVMPLIKLLRYLRSSPRLQGRRMRAVTVSAGLILGAAAVIGGAPVGQTLYAPGVVEAERFAETVTDSAGRLLAWRAQAGQRVAVGDELAQLSDPKMAWEIEAAQAGLDQIEALIAQARADGAADLTPLRRQRQAVDEQLTELQRRRQAMTIRAKQAGVWAPDRDSAELGAWLPRGARVGWIVDPSAFRFTAVIDQQQAPELVEQPVSGAQVRLHGQAGIVLRAEEITISPQEMTQLPTAALGWRGGGSVAVKPDSPGGVEAAAPFFLLRAALQTDESMPLLLHGRTGRARLRLASRTLATQWEESTRAFLQQRLRW
ncbi:site-2 protease family protein [Magnetofaba australis]|nr:site-2 protease family protein [Magnetofaba australis]